VPIIAVLLLVLVVLTVLIPLGIVQRFRMGTARRQARQWLVSINLAGVACSVAVLLVAAMITTRWVPEAFTYTLAGLAVGCVLGVLGTALTRWEYGPRGLQYTPNRWVVLAVTAIVASRLAYGVWRSWQAWRASVESMTWVAAAGVAASMSAGAAVLGYYLVFWAGVRHRIRRQNASR
jgi:hypothetical protein